MGAQFGCFEEKNWGENNLGARQSMISPDDGSIKNNRPSEKFSDGLLIGHHDFKSMALKSYAQKHKSAFQV